MEVITTHVNADFDTIASMVAAKKLYPGAVLVLPGSKEESVKGFLLQSALYALDMRKAREIDLSEVTRLVLVDIRNASRIGVFRELVGKPGVEIHVYEKQAQRRFVMVNGRKYREGERLAEGPALIEIVPEGMVLEFRGEKVLYTLAR